MTSLGHGISDVIVALFAVPVLAAQEFRGTVRDDASHEPVPGAVVILRDSAGRTLSQLLTSDRGQFRTTLLADARRLRVVRIGYRPFETALAPGAGGTIDVALAAIPILLEPVHVATGASCPRRADADAAMALLEQARAGLLAVMVARSASPAELVRLGYERRLRGTTEQIVHQTVRREAEREASVSFSAERSPAEFVTRGFMTERWGERRFLAPDADILLNDAFALGYCFRLAEPERTRPSQVGLEFRAASRDEGRVDIEGILWMDTLAQALVDIVFHYRGLDAETERHRPGGRIAFRTMPNGLVLIDSWHLRLVGVEQIPHYDPRSQRTYDRFWSFYTDVGGELASAKWPDREWHASLGRLRLHAMATDGTPVPGITLHLHDTHYRATADSSGVVEMADLVPGPYSLMVVDPRLAPLDLELPTGVRFVAARDSTTERNFRVPTAEDYTYQRCLADRRTSPGDRLILGRVFSPDGPPVVGIEVYLTRADAPRRLGTARTDADGLFQFCLRAEDGGFPVALEAGRLRVVRTMEPGLNVVPLAWMR